MHGHIAVFAVLARRRRQPAAVVEFHRGLAGQVERGRPRAPEKNELAIETMELAYRYFVKAPGKPPRRRPLGSHADAH